MVKLLLDEHISPHVVEGLRRRNPKLRVFCMRDWEHGRFVGAEDDLVLAEAAAQGLSWVTYDLRTIPSILKTWAEEGRSHGGVVLVDEKTISTDDIGGLVLALLQLSKESQRWDWRDRVVFLQR
ncbi:MAG: hypothetical protein JO300_15095 [Silvibacterium sp.]|nr:hypothetical protein [Silvibacterium sp.]MBV8438529.1 hypothetical protein [Silvibacterium sp.]MBV8631834.1 hypothetical protein [Silvibacterium sp.]